ncbi:PqqD family protein (plasmid) [Deinococcus wulumuqiensis]|uniref:PqqD family protein n=1 Tax=Deinococcus wulumuqiensis TaxID=980427 RepID=A0A345ILY7_9DEIO|nr:PqqD family protein [Deinococcus wulumuqiensis]AXH00710.1 PqqD family protein [Deinococcus wulumuqiensis]
MWTANPDILVTDLGDELVLMDPQGSLMFSLNAAGRLLWQSLPASADTLAQRLQTTYGLGAAQARADSQAVLDDLAARRLVKLV